MRRWRRRFRPPFRLANRISPALIRADADPDDSTDPGAYARADTFTNVSADGAPEPAPVAAAECAANARADGAPEPAPVAAAECAADAGPVGPAVAAPDAGAVARAVNRLPQRDEDLPAAYD
jgi:hypothetical protein